MSVPKNAATITWRRAKTGELFSDGDTHVYFDDSYTTTTCRDNLMCRPIDDELERLRAFAREIMNFDGVLNVDQKMYAARKHGITADSLKVTVCA